VAQNQGDQIGRIFSMFWAIVYFREFFENLQKYVAENFGMVFPTENVLY
jgi:hypothetical protein